MEIYKAQDRQRNHYTDCEIQNFDQIWTTLSLLPELIAVFSHLFILFQLRSWHQIVIAYGLDIGENWESEETSHGQETSGHPWGRDS